MIESFATVAVGLGLGLLIWDCVEVGRNDAANLVNAVFFPKNPSESDS